MEKLNNEDEESNPTGRYDQAYQISYNILEPTFRNDNSNVRI